MPLVTVGVISYNSSKTVLETLESIFNQKYENIELIISDDCSKDNTVDICSQWLEEHSNRFVRTKLLTSPQNTGTSANCNRVLREVKGLWYKEIAADDILLPNCIECSVKYVNHHQNVDWLVGKMVRFKDKIDEHSIYDSGSIYNHEFKSLFDLSADEQFRKILPCNFIESPATFIRYRLLEEAGGYDERYPLFEDKPMNMKLMKLGYKCYFLDEYVVGYRQSDNSVTNSNNRLFSLPYMKSWYRFNMDVVSRYCVFTCTLNAVAKYLLCKLFVLFNLNRQTSFLNFAYNKAKQLIDCVFPIYPKK